MKPVFRLLLSTAALLAAQPADENYSKFVARIDDALGARAGARIADIGTGAFLAQPLRIAEKVGATGKVVCVDVKASVIAKLKEQIEAKHATNIEVILGKDDDPLLSPATFDAILVSNTYHEFTQPAVMLQHIAAALKPGGRLVVAELFSEAHKTETRDEQTKRHDFSPDMLEKELIAAGFIIIERIAPVPVESEGDRFRYAFRAEKTK
jgi:SAM-dependent methyltransferase